MSEKIPLSIRVLRPSVSNIQARTMTNSETDPRHLLFVRTCSDTVKPKPPTSNDNCPTHLYFKVRMQKHIRKSQMCWIKQSRTSHQLVEQTFNNPTRVTQTFLWLARNTKKKHYSYLVEEKQTRSQLMPVLCYCQHANQKLHLAHYSCTTSWNKIEHILTSKQLNQGQGLQISCLETLYLVLLMVFFFFFFKPVIILIAFTLINKQMNEINSQTRLHLQLFSGQTEKQREAFQLSSGSPVRASLSLSLSANHRWVSWLRRRQTDGRFHGAPTDWHARTSTQGW